MQIILWSFDQSPSNWILIAVTHNFIQRFITADTVVIIIFLPKGSISDEVDVNLLGGVPLQRLHELRQSLFVSELENSMDVVWHNHDAYPLETFIHFQPIKALKNEVRRSGVC